MGFELSIDIGGTFTDLYVRDPAGETGSFKIPTTPDNPTGGFMAACEKAAAAYDLERAELFARTERVIHGTTIATNAIIEGTTSTTALLCTAGFGDTLTLREGGKRSPYDWDEAYPEPYVPKWLTYGVDERVSPEGDVMTPLDEDDVLAAIDDIQERGDVEAVAVALLWSHVNPAHEKRIGDLLDEHAPDLHYSLSHRVNPIIREYRRTSSTAINASLFGPISDYLSTLEGKLAASGYDGDPLIISANGGLLGIDEIARTPIWIVDSGPTMLPVAARWFAETELGVDDVIALDMGGTSLDMGAVTGGTIPRTREAKVGDDMLGIEKVEVQSIGSGGGSIAWVDEGGLLHVGPESAGADPGPACYMRGGERPTVTDAALALGYLNADYFLGGEMTIDPDAAAAAIEEYVADPLGLRVTEAAYAVYTTANQDMITGIQDVTIERGLDPGNYVIAGGGGALGVHAAALADELGIDEVLLPDEAGVISSIGGLISDIRRDFSGSHVTESSDFDHGAINDLLASLESDAEAFFDRANVPADRRTVRYHAEARYPDQVWELEVELPGDRIRAGDENTLVETFHEVHEDRYGFRMDEQGVEFLYWRVEAIGETGGGDAAAPAGTEGRTPDPTTREAYFDGSVVTAPAYRPANLPPGFGADGPAFVDAKNTTVVIPPGAHLTITDRGNFHVEL